MAAPYRCVSFDQMSPDSDLTRPQFERSALITIDVQRDVLDGQPLEIAGSSAALGAMCELAQAFRDCTRPIVHIVRLYRPDGSNVDLCRREAVRQGWQALAPQSSGAQLAPGLAPAGHEALDGELLLGGGIQRLDAGEVAIYKPRWGAFYDTPLREHLARLRVSTLVFCGVNFPNCPRTSIYEASERDFRIALASDAISGLYERGMRELANIGVTLAPSREVIEQLRLATGRLVST
jgi:nicotinamidase-related amidase